MEYGFFALSELPHARLLTVTGEIDMSNSAALEKQIADAVDGTRPVVLDLSECTFIDSSGLAALVRQNRVLGEKLIVVVPLDARIRKVFTITQLVKKLNVVPTLADSKNGPPP